MKNFSIGIVLSLLLGTYALATLDSIPHSNSIQNQRGSRILALAANEDSTRNYDKTIKVAKSAGAQAVSLPLPWDDIEKSPGVFQMSPNLLAIANAYYPSTGLKIALGINPVDTNKNRVPAYLKGKPFDAPEVIESYMKLLDYVFSQIPSLELTSLSIGNEIDGSLHSNEQWKQYANFFKTVSAYARTKRKGLKVGTKGMFYGMTHSKMKEFQMIHTHADIIMVTYYPLKEGFVVKNPSTIHKDFKNLIQLYPEKAIYVMEIGYPSGTLIKSSEERQAQFIHEAFKMWDRYQDRIGLMQFTWLHDQSSEALEYFESYYGTKDKGFLSFLGTLGLRSRDGEDKAAFRQLKLEAGLRGWR